MTTIKEVHPEPAGEKRWRVTVVDTKTYGVKYNLTAACEFLKIDTSDLVAHRAAADVEMVDRIYQKMCLDL